MTDELTTDPTASTVRTDGGPSASPTPSDGDDRPAEDGDRSALEYVQWTALAVLALVAVVATFRFYFAVSAAVDTFVTHRYRPLFMAGFNLAVVLACGIGVSALVRRLT